MIYVTMWKLYLPMSAVPCLDGQQETLEAVALGTFGTNGKFEILHNV